MRNSTLTKHLGELKGRSVNRMKVTDVTIYNISKREPNSKLYAFAKIELNNQFIIHGIRIYEGDNGPFMTFPQDSGHPGIKDQKIVCHPTTAELRVHINEHVMAEYEFSSTTKVS